MRSRGVSMRTERSSTRSASTSRVDKPADGLLRAGELLARARGVPPAADRVHRLRARRAADRADAARRRVRVRRAAAARAAADHLGPAVARSGRTRARRSGSASRRRPAAARSRARLAKIDTAIYRRKRIEFEYHTMGRDETALAPGGPVPPAVRGRAVLPRRLRARAQGRARVPALADPRQGRLRDQGRARLPAPDGLRPARLREPDPVAARRPGRASPRSRSPRTSPGTSSASTAPTGPSTGSVFRTAYAIAAAADLVGAELRAADPRPAGAGRRRRARASTS